MYNYDKIVKTIKGDFMNQDIFLLIGKNIKKFRQKKGYSLKDLSLLTKINIEELEKIELEGATANTNLETLNTIAVNLKIKIIDLFHKD